jgi:hypothetical protein
MRARHAVSSFRCAAHVLVGLLRRVVQLISRDVGYVVGTDDALYAGGKVTKLLFEPVTLVLALARFFGRRGVGSFAKRRLPSFA